ncbi:MAG: PQQ-dependent sugar dehydrogenase [Ignavibacteriaceae bacterium]
MGKYLLSFYISLLCCSKLLAQYEAVNAFPNLSFKNAVDFQSPGDGSNRIFIVEQEGIIRVFQNNPETSSYKIFLDIKDRVAYSGEMGLLGLAFHPDYSQNGFFYVDYTSTNPNRHTVVARYKVSSSNPDSADKNSETIILTQEQPFSNHNGGKVAFGPDGYMYISFGDGGSGGDPYKNGQNLSTYLGKILRIDLNSTNGDLFYSIPPSNPFVGNTFGYKEEIYAYGLRNPWRYSFDLSTNKLWCADVGQDQWEEIDTIQKGKNYGWNIMEGNHCYNPSSGCDTSGLTLPVWEYNHSSGNCSITGGYVYRGKFVPGLAGKYIYADYCTSNIWALDISSSSPQNQLLFQAPGHITAFGIDQNNELYFCNFDGSIYKFKSASTGISSSYNAPGAFKLYQNFPNPFNPSTKISYYLPEAGNIKIEIVNELGKVLHILENRYKPAGSYEIEWDASGYSSGIYYAKIIVKSNSGSHYYKTIKMVLLK